MKIRPNRVRRIVVTDVEVEFVGFSLALSVEADGFEFAVAFWLGSFGIGTI